MFLSIQDTRILMFFQLCTRVPQGYGPSGDGYTRRTDDILSATPDKPGMVDIEKIVDDILVWSETILSWHHKGVYLL